MSRKLLPKQFLPLVTERSLFQDTALRLKGLKGAGAPMVVANSEHRFVAAEQLHAIGVEPRAMLLEPVGQNTAPAIAAAALLVAKDDPDAVLLVLPSDHLIGDVRAFRRAASRAAALAAQGYLVTFGISPAQPATGYGYIQAGEPIAKQKGAYRIRRLVEKPSAARARSFLARGGFLCNSGMFAFTARRYLEELRRHRPAIAAAAKKGARGRRARPRFSPPRGKRLRRLPRRLGRLRGDGKDRLRRGGARRHALERRRLLVRALGDGQEGQGPKRLARRRVAARRDALLRARRQPARLGARRRGPCHRRDRRRRARHLARASAGGQRSLARLDRHGRAEDVSHTRVYRPWGYYESVDAGERFQVKRLMVKPGHALSLQLHRKRAEHWVVVSGQAKVTRGEDVMTLGENY